MQHKDNLFIAHRFEEGNESHLLLSHLNDTAKRAGKFAHRFGSSELAASIALGHDIGKYCAKFQRRIRGENLTVDHSTPGGQLMWSQNDSPLGMIAAYCIMGHHGGLPDGGSTLDSSDEPTLHGRRKRAVEDCSEYIHELALPRLNPSDKIPRDGFGAAFFIRMLFSVLVDADFLDTEAFFQGKARRDNETDIAALQKRLEKQIASYINPTTPLSELNSRRTNLLSNCLSASQETSGLFTLTAPTGSGKTIASLAFALSHAAKWNKRRVIYIVPYNTITEQNAAVFEGLLGEEHVLQHHSNVQYDDGSEESSRKRLATENWDYPVIVTSSVQFFQSLFGSKTSVCRKLHNIADSVLVFDEAQMIPAPYLIPCVRAIRELVEEYSCTAVLATATQSALDRFFKPLMPREITEDPRALYDFLRRATIVTLSQPLTDDDLANRLSGHEQVLCIVNTRRMAQILFQKLLATQSDGTFHLSTLMTPFHRSKVLKEIRSCLSNRQDCRVISTSLVEAGVDLDFPVVYRAQAGLDSIVQAAGRCNREGKRPAAESFVYAFTSGEHKPPRVIEQNIAAARTALRKHDDPASLQAITSYFEQLYYVKGQEALDSKNIVRKMNGSLRSFSFPFREISEKFKLIEEDTRVVYYLKEASDFEERLRSGERSRDLFRKLGAHSVSLYPSDFQALYEIGAVERLDEGVFLLLDYYYDKDFGVILSPKSGQALFL